jgi:TonB-dependent receptor
MLEYFFEPAGYVAAGWFHKEITNYIVSNIDSGTIGSGADNGYGGEYAGFTRLTSANAGTAFVQGWEFSYSQQFTFLPGPLKGLGASGNYTILQTHGDFGGTTYLAGGQVAGFIPRTANATVFWKYGRIGARLMYNYTSPYTSSYSSTNPALNLVRKTREMYTVSLSYQFHPAVAFSVDVENITNEPQTFYRGYGDRIYTYVRNGTTINFGISGRF